MKVIIVDDAQHVREGLGQHLERQGHDVIQCASAQEALLRADSYGADLLVTREHLPDMTSEQMVKQFHQWAPYRTVLCPCWS